MTDRFTGRHMAAILVGFFAIVIAVNFIMARFATATFGGALADNGYVASQDYNRWIAEARDRDRLGWNVTASVEDRRLVLSIKGTRNAGARVRLVHPLGRVAETDLAMRADGPERLISEARVPSGRWQAQIVVSKEGREARFLREIAR